MATDLLQGLGFGEADRLRSRLAAVFRRLGCSAVECRALHGGGEVVRFLARHGESRAAKTAFYRAVPEGPFFYGYNRDRAKPVEGVIANWWRQGMIGGAKAHHDGVVAFAQTDFTDDLREIQLPVLVIHGEDDQVVPYEASGPLTADLLSRGTVKTYNGFRTECRPPMPM